MEGAAVKFDEDYCDPDDQEMTIASKETSRKEERRYTTIMF